MGNVSPKERKNELMRMLTGLIVASLALVLLPARPVQAQPSPYFQAVTNLNPAGYWPMHEVEAPAPGDIETNYGTLGLLGTGYYPDWVGNPTPVMINRGAPGALAGDSDPAVYFTYPSSNSGSTTNSLYVPHTSPLSTLNPPFSVECWFYPTNASDAGDVWSQAGYEGLNAGASGGGLGNVCGIRLYWNENSFVVYTYKNSSTLNNPCSKGSIAVGQWYHVVVTADAATNISLYVNGSQAGATKAAASLYAPDYWTPFQVGNGRGTTRAVQGIVDEVAVYTNVLTDISAHYAAGTNASPSTPYFQLVTNDAPVIYLRMDGPAYSAPSVSAWPVLTNYGSAGANGVYTPGTMPGIVTGPLNPNGVPFYGLAGAKVAQFSGVSSFADAGYAAQYDPAGPTPFTVTAMFRGNPADNRFQNIVGHSDNSWRLAMNTNGTLQGTLGTNSASVVNSAGVYNDGCWHHVVEVYTPGSTGTGTNALFVDGLLDTAVSTVSTDGIGPGSTMDVMIAADPQYTNSPAGVGRQFAGQVCEVAFFTNALTLNQIQTLYNAGEVAPFITVQPAPGRGADGGAGTSVYFGVAACGASPLAYQWYFNTNASYSGATRLVDNIVKYTNSTTSRLTVTNLAAADSGYYYVVITNNYGSVTSALASLTVYSAPAIANSNLPPFLVLPAGKSYTYSVEVTGSVPLSYQWYSGAAPVAAATNASYTVTAGSPGAMTTYRVVITNLQGSISATSLLTVVAVPTDPYATNILGLNPVGYWPLQETNAPAPVTMETNYGTLGSLGNAYYAMNAGPSPRVTFNQGGALTGSGDSDAAVAFSGPSGTNYLFVPRVTPALTVQPPLTYEAWINSSSTSFSDIMGEGGSGLNSPGNSGNFGGIRMSYGGSSSGANLQAYAYTGAGVTYTSFGTPANTLPVGLWHHCVLTYDGATAVLYVDGQPQATYTALAMVPDTWSPLTIGDGRWQGGGTGPTRPFTGTLDEVAVYTNALTATQVANHYAAAVTSGGHYKQTVLNDGPLLYYRMDAPGYVTPNPALYPTVVNFGSAPVNGAYLGGIVPGGVPGPAPLGLSRSLAAPINGVISCIDAGSDPAFNPTGMQPFSGLLWFQGYPCDGRVQTLMSQGTNWALNLDGTNGYIVCTLSGVGSITAYTPPINDGNWHMVAGAFDGTTGSLYVDGGLYVSGPVNGLAGEPGADLLLGGDAEFTAVGINQQYFAGAIAQAALFTNALTAAQVSQIYSLLLVPPPTPTISLAGSGNHLVITYTGTLLSSTNVTGPYSPVTGASPPYTISPSNARMFYRTGQ
jgi:hypothetical protein